MLCFEVFVNGKQKWAAGVQGGGDLLAVLSTERVGADTAAQGATLEAVGVRDRDRSVWTAGPVNVGDSITITLVDRDTCDPPEHVERLPQPVSITDSAVAEAVQSRCSFCHRTAGADRTLVAGPPVQICNDCISLCLHLSNAAAERERKE